MTVQITDPKLWPLLALLVCLLLVLLVGIPALFIWKARRIGMLPSNWTLGEALSRQSKAFGSALSRHARVMIQTALGFGLFWGAIVILFGFAGGAWAAFLGGGLWRWPAALPRWGLESSRTRDAGLAREGPRLRLQS